MPIVSSSSFQSVFNSSLARLNELAISPDMIIAPGDTIERAIDILEQEAYHRVGQPGGQSTMPITMEGRIRERELSQPSADLFTMGWELESTQECRPGQLPEGIVSGTDGSVNGAGVEYRLRERFVSSPRDGMRALFNLVKKDWVETDRSCGFHVHLGLRNETESKSRVWAAWMITLAKNIEDSVFASVPNSRQNNSYCMRWKGVYITEGSMRYRYARNKGENSHRYQWINPVEMFRSEGIRTVENRLMGDTKDYYLLLAWISAYMMMGRTALELIEDPSLLDVRVEGLKSVYENVGTIMRRRTNRGCREAVRLGRQVGLTPARTVSLRPTDTFAVEGVEISRRAMEAFQDRSWSVSDPRPF